MPEPLLIGAAGIAAGAAGNAYLSDKFDHDDAKILEYFCSIDKSLQKLAKALSPAGQTLVYLEQNVDGGGITTTSIEFTPNTGFQIIGFTLWADSAGIIGITIGSTTDPMRVNVAGIYVPYPHWVPGGVTIKLTNPTSRISFRNGAHLVGYYNEDRG